MQVSYGPPAHRGVTHLMSVGADETPDPADSPIGLVALATCAAMLLGAPRPIVKLGALGVVGLGLFAFAKRHTRTVEVTKPVGYY
ncbi:MAG TPA: hypothetical protein VFD36_20450 [Kofleriaceae bacterium]|nr:hypothetical protein [Kofleriaceae bacterium]